MILAQRLYLPNNIEAIMWDMDGVLVDSLGLDMTVCNDLLREQFGERVRITRDFVSSIFAYSPDDFWRLILEHVAKQFAVEHNEDQFRQMLEVYEEARRTVPFSLNPGILEILEDARAKQLKLAVVSNNPTEDVKASLKNAGILDKFDEVVGNDIKQLQKKPAPDTYLFGAELLRVDPRRSVVVEDSLLGSQAGFAAGCFVVGVATGGDSFTSLQNSGSAHRVYQRFEIPEATLSFGNVMNKRIVTPNDFISHAIEHIYWRLGAQGTVSWFSNDWRSLGNTLGERIGVFEPNKKEAVALGMIDDGSAEVLIETPGDGSFSLEGTENVDMDWFVSLRCEQARSGQELIELLQGLAEGLNSKIHARICSFQDPHHTWEGLFRAVGIALNKTFAPESTAPDCESPSATMPQSGEAIQVIEAGCRKAAVRRTTAESDLHVLVDFDKKSDSSFDIQVADSINVRDFGSLLGLLSAAAGFSLSVDYKATVLSSSHVVLEDTGLVLGRALKEIMVRRMQELGVNGAGSSLESLEDFQESPIRVGLSVEGRKFVKIVPFSMTEGEIRRTMLIGQNVLDGLYSEDMDDFLDGLAGGLGASIMIHVKDSLSATDAWTTVFTNLGLAIKEAFEYNPYRKGVPPGVKATLA